MFSLGGFGADENYAVTLEEQRRGGLVLEPESDDDGNEKPMDEGDDEYIAAPRHDDDDEENETTIEYDLLKFPPPQPWIEYVGHTFRFKGDTIPDTLASFPPNVLKSLAAITGGTAIQKAAICFHPCMPCPVHASPLVSLFQNKGLRPGEKGTTNTYKDTHVSFLFSCYQLQQLKTACLGGLIPFHRSMTATKLKAAQLEYAHQLKQMDRVQNALIDELYARRSNETEFIAVLEQYSLQYIHLLEYFLHSLLVAPFGDAIPLEAVLTPNELPDLSECTPAKRKQVVDDAIVFFKHKSDTRIDQEWQNVQKGQQTVDAAVGTKRIRYEDISTPPAGVAVYKGYMPATVLMDYYHFLDVDNTLGEN